MWLDEIEEEYDLVAHPSKYIDSPRGQMERMARVLREQNEYMKLITDVAENALGGLKNITHGINKTLVIAIENQIIDAKQKLSDDAKELLRIIRHE